MVSNSLKRSSATILVPSEASATVEIQSVTARTMTAATRTAGSTNTKVASFATKTSSPTRLRTKGTTPAVAADTSIVAIEIVTIGQCGRTHSRSSRTNTGQRE